MNETIVNLALSILLASGSVVKTDILTEKYSMTSLSYVTTTPFVGIFLFQVSNVCTITIQIRPNNEIHTREFGLPNGTCEDTFKKTNEKSDKKIIDILNEEFKKQGE